MLKSVVKKLLFYEIFSQQMIANFLVKEVAVYQLNHLMHCDFVSRCGGDRSPSDIV